MGEAGHCRLHGTYIGPVASSWLWWPGATQTQTEARSPATNFLALSPRATGKRFGSAYFSLPLAARIAAPARTCARAARAPTTDDERHDVRSAGVADWENGRTGEHGAYAHRLGGPSSLRPLWPRPCKAATPKGPAFCFFLKLQIPLIRSASLALPPGGMVATSSLRTTTTVAHVSFQKIKWNKRSPTKATVDKWMHYFEYARDCGRRQ